MAERFALAWATRPRSAVVCLRWWMWSLNMPRAGKARFFVDRQAASARTLEPVLVLPIRFGNWGPSQALASLLSPGLDRPPRTVDTHVVLATEHRDGEIDRFEALVIGPLLPLGPGLPQHERGIAI